MYRVLDKDHQRWIHLMAVKVRMALALPVKIGFRAILVPAHIAKSGPKLIAAKVFTSTLNVLKFPDRRDYSPVTVISWLFPIIALPVAVALTVVVPCPELITHPVGKVQL